MIIRRKREREREREREYQGKEMHTTQHSQVLECQRSMSSSLLSILSIHPLSFSSFYSSSSFLFVLFSHSLLSYSSSSFLFILFSSIPSLLSYSLSFLLFIPIINIIRLCVSVPFSFLSFLFLFLFLLFLFHLNKTTCGYCCGFGCRPARLPWVTRKWVPRQH